MFEFKTGAKVVQIERKTKFYLSFSEMKPIFDLILEVKDTKITFLYTSLSHYKPDRAPIHLLSTNRQYPLLSV